MTPNDKLPGEIIRQIESDAKKAATIIEWGEYDSGPASSARMAQGSRIDPIQKEFYIKGATAWAPWKVMYDELKERLDKMAHLLYMLQSVHSHEWSEGNQENVKQTLQQWQQFKDGGKEVEDTCRCILPNYNAFTGKCLTCGKQ